MQIKTFLTSVLTLVFVINMIAQDSRVINAVTLFENGNYEEAISEINLALRYPKELKQENHARAYLYRALSKTRILNSAVLNNNKDKINEYESAYLESYYDLLKARKFDDGTLEKQIIQEMNSLYGGLAQYGMLALNKGLDESNNADNAMNYFKVAENYMNAAVSIKDNYLVNDILAQAIFYQGDSARAYPFLEKATELYISELPGTPDFLIAYSYYRMALIERYNNLDLDKSLGLLVTGKELIDSEFTRYLKLIESGELKKNESIINQYSLAYNDLMNFELDIYMNYPAMYNEAVIRFENAILEKPDDYSIRVAYASLLEGKNPEKAVEVYKDAISIDSLQSLAWFNLGAIYYNAGKQYYDAAGTEIDPGKYELMMDEAAKYFVEAKYFFEKVIELEPGSQESISALKNISMILNDDEAYEKYRQMEDN